MKSVYSFVDDWLWQHCPDQYDRFLEHRHDVNRRLLALRCFLIGHSIEYAAPNPNGFDGEWEAYCGRCEADGSDRMRGENFPDTLPWKAATVYYNLRWRLGLDKADE